VLAETFRGSLLILESVVSSKERAVDSGWKTPVGPQDQDVEMFDCGEKRRTATGSPRLGGGTLEFMDWAT